MSKAILKVVSYIIVFVMVIEVVFINVDSSVFSKEGMSIEDMAVLKEKALEWLEENQNNDGHWGKELKIYNTTQVLSNIAYQEGLEDKRVKALNWLNETDANSNDDLFRIYLAKVKENEYLSYKLENIDFANLQNADGGFGISKEYKSDVLDTVLALECMLESDNVNNDEIRKITDYLHTCQNEDGGFSYPGNASNTYLTAYTYKIIRTYLNESNHSAIQLMSEKSKAYLLENEQDNSLWGLEEDTIRNSIMSSIALMTDDEDMLNRIAAISNKLSEDGSMYNDVELTSLYVSLINEYEIVTGNSGLNHVKIKGITVSADKERIGAYTEMTFVPDVLGIDDNMKVIAVVSGGNGYSETLDETKENTFIWNTENNIGKYEIIIAVIDRADGSVIAGKTKKFDILESFEVTSFTANVTPKAYKIDSGKNIKIDISAFTLANVDKEIMAEVNIRNKEGDLLFADSKEISGGKDNKELNFEEFVYKPELKESALLYVTVFIEVDGMTLKTKTSYIKAYVSEDENRIDVDYSVSSNYVYPETKDLDVDFVLSGKGLSENEKRKPIDIAVVLDDSGSMSREDWIKSINGAETIVKYMQPEDRMEVRFFKSNKPEIKFTNDKEQLIQILEKRKGDRPYSYTFTYAAINRTIKDFGDDDRDKVIYLFTDGTRSGLIDERTVDEESIKSKNIRIFGVFLENETSLSKIDAATEMMKYLTTLGNGKSINASSNDEIETSVKELLGDIFTMAGKDIKLSMTLGKDVPFKDISFDAAPDSAVKNDDGTTTITYEKNYLSVGEDLKLNLNYNLSNMTAEEKVNLIKDIKFTYTNDNDEIIRVDLEDIFVDIVGNISNVIPEKVREEDEGNNDKTVVMTEQNDSSILSHNKPELNETEDKDLISGSISVSNNVLYVGDKLTADVALVSDDSMGTSKVNTRIVLVDKNNESSAGSTDKIIELSNGNKSENKIEMKTDNLYEGDYIAILMAEVNGEMTPLDATGVTLNEHKYELTVTAGDGGCVSDVSGEYKSGEVVTVKASSEDGFVFDRWESEDIRLENNQVNSSEIKIVMPDKAVNIKAIFAQKTENTIPDNIEQESSADIGNPDPNNNVSNVIINKENKNNNQKNLITENRNESKEIATVPNKKNHKAENDSKVSNNSLLSPMTGDFVTRDNIKIMLLVQSVALIVICAALRNKEQKEKGDKSCR